MKNKKLLLILFALTGLGINANSQIYYQDIIPDVIMNSWDSKDVHIDSSATSILSYGAPGNLTIWEEFGTRIVINAFSECNVLMNGTYPAALDLNQLIESTGTWVQPNYAILNNGSQGNWMGVTDKYLGVRVQSGTQWLYGWIRMDVNASGTIVTIKDYACNRTLDASINAGQTTTSIINDPSRGEDNLVSIYPNPFNLWTTIKTSKKSDKASLTIYDIQGQEIKTINNVSCSETKLYRADLQNGVYFIRLKQGNTISNIKIIISD